MIVCADFQSPSCGSGVGFRVATLYLKIYLEVLKILGQGRKIVPSGGALYAHTVPAPTGLHQGECDAAGGLQEPLGQD